MQLFSFLEPSFFFEHTIWENNCINVYFQERQLSTVKRMWALNSYRQEFESQLYHLIWSLLIYLPSLNISFLISIAGNNNAYQAVKNIKLGQLCIWYLSHSRCLIIVAISIIIIVVYYYYYLLYSYSAMFKTGKVYGHF